MVHTILSVDDDPEWQDGLVSLLKKQNYRTMVAPDGPTALKTIQENRVNLVLLDLRLGDPNFEGAAVCHEMRALDPKLPIIMLSAFGSTQNRRMSLKMGADVFFQKGDDDGVLLEQIARLITRAWPSDGPGPVHIAPIRVKELVIDPLEASVTINNENVGVTPLEFDLLFFLSSHPGQAFSFKDLLHEVWHFGWENIDEADVDIVKTCISRLRRKLGDVASDPTYIITARNKHYKFCTW